MHSWGLIYVKLSLSLSLYMYMYIYIYMCIYIYIYIYIHMAEAWTVELASAAGDAAVVFQEPLQDAYNNNTNQHDNSNTNT